MGVLWLQWASEVIVKLRGSEMNRINNRRVKGAEISDWQNPFYEETDENHTQSKNT